MRAPSLLPLLAAALLAPAACGRAPARVEPAARELPAAVQAFSVYDLETRWTDQAGRERTLASLSGRVQVVAMVYTTCAHTCPMIIAELKRLEAGLRPEGGAGFVLVSLDPERDTPARLAEFAASTRLDPAAWTLFTGSEDGVRELAALLGIRYRAEADGEFSHANTYLVLDAEGRIVHRQDGLGGGTGPVLARIHAAAAR